MHFPSSLLVTLCSIAPALAASKLPRADSQWPHGPFSVDGRWVKDASGNNVNLAGTNWPGHGEVMVPEGLQYRSVKEIASQIKSLGMNAVRLTYAIEMVDQIYDNDGKDVSLETAFIKGLGESNGTRVLQQVLKHNPSFTKATTRLEVYDAVTSELAQQELHIVLDNHMSKGKWCCNGDDGNTWWGDREFDTEKWIRGLRYMANHGKSWTALVAMSLRNELREATDNPELVKSSYNWQTWYKYIQQGADAVNEANPDTLIYLSGLGYDTWITPVFEQTALEPGKEIFNKDDFSGYSDKLVLEIHNYERNIGSCASLKNNLYTKGFQGMNASDPDTKEIFPVQLTEFGHPMNDKSWQDPYSTCLSTYLPEIKAGWFIWVIVGSYYARQGVQDSDEVWGLLSHDWSQWRNPEYIEKQLKPMVQRTLS
ncbi:hypothetical protein FZEAL_475 [Fusarium zealandicum]|uniref:Glycoside hydrolase family 5 domain-containing protein n=1 Tax=Fusarium zealandicum TaxID=1053134 RepID=A0A8H4UUQ5_9HYPO|nr:hypothetical protein FZEAL_475 [Fusarium zealandicum]